MTRERLKALLAEYGRVAIYTYFALFFLVLAGFSAGIAWGFEVAGAEQGGLSGLGILGAAYLATKATQPIRIAATLGLTPLVAAALHKLALRRSPGGNTATNPEPPPAELAEKDRAAEPAAPSEARPSAHTSTAEPPRAD